nr:hypothetical transcript [Hymenolepis microstoma]
MSFYFRSDNCTPRYEQTKITVTARIYTTLPDTGERMYLSDILPEGANFDDLSSQEYSHLSHRPAELDVTHLLPSWSLRLRPFPSTSDFAATSPRQPAVIFRNKRSPHPILIGRSEGHVRIELIAAPKDSQPLAFKDVSVVSTEKNDFVRLKVECVSWVITLSGHLEPHPSAETLLRSTTDSFGAAIVNEEVSQAILPNEKEMIADFASNPHPRVLNLIIRGQDPPDLNVVTAQVNSNDLPNASSSNQNVFCPLGKLALSLVLEDGCEMGLHLLPEGQVRVSAQLQTTRKSIVWDPSKVLRIAPVTEEGKALVAAGKIGLGPMVDVKTTALWAGQPICSPRPSRFLPDTRPLISLSSGSQEDPGSPVDGLDWEHDAIKKFRRDTGSTPISPFDYSRSHFLVPRDSQNSDNHNFTDAQAASFFSVPMKYALFSIIIFSAIFFSVGCLALIIARHRRIVKRRKARIEDDPNNPVNGVKLPEGIFPVSPHMSTTTAATATTMNPGLSCSSVFSGNSGGAHTPAQTAELINQWTGRQSHQILPQPQCSSCSNSVGTRSPELDIMKNDLRASAMVDLRFGQVKVPSMKMNSPQTGMMSLTSPNFSNKWRAPESLGSAPSSRNTGSPSTNDEGFAPGPLDLQAKRHIYSRGDNGGWSLGVSETIQSPYPCQNSSPHTSHHSSDIIRGSTCGYIQGGYMGTSMGGPDSNRFYGVPSADSMPPRLTLAHDPESIGTSKYLSKLNKPPPSLLLPSDMMKMETSHTAGAGFIGDTTEDKMLMDSGRESQDKTSSSGTSSGMNKDFSSLSGIEMTQVDV